MTAHERLTRVLAEELPITQHMGLAVAEVSEAGLALRLPLAPNRNHKGTLFAGSLNAVATLSGWGFLWLLLQDSALAGHVVIQDSSMEYLLPVSTECVARCDRPATPVLSRFVDTLRRRRRARIRLEVGVWTGSALAARFVGRYVAELERP